MVGQDSQLFQGTSASNTALNERQTHLFMLDAIRRKAPAEKKKHRDIFPIWEGMGVQSEWQNMKPPPPILAATYRGDNIFYLHRIPRTTSVAAAAWTTTCLSRHLQAKRTRLTQCLGEGGGGWGMRKVKLTLYFLRFFRSSLSECTQHTKTKRGGQSICYLFIFPKNLKFQILRQYFNDIMSSHCESSSISSAVKMALVLRWDLGGFTEQTNSARVLTIFILIVTLPLVVFPLMNQWASMFFRSLQSFKNWLMDPVKCRPGRTSLNFGSAHWIKTNYASQEVKTDNMVFCSTPPSLTNRQSP